METGLEPTTSTHPEPTRSRTGWLLLAGFAGATGAVAVYALAVLTPTGPLTVARVVGYFTAAIAGVCAATSRWTVMRTLSAID